MNIKANQFINYFSGISDPRLVTKNRRYELKEILTLVILAVIWGADNWAEIEAFGKGRLKILRTLFAYKNGIPSHDTLGSVGTRICPKQFQTCFMVWIQALAVVSKGELMAMDAKTLRRVYNKYDGKCMIYMVNAWSCYNEAAFGQYQKYQKSKKATAMRGLLHRLDIYVAEPDSQPGTVKMKQPELVK